MIVRGQIIANFEAAVGNSNANRGTGGRPFFNPGRRVARGCLVQDRAGKQVCQPLDRTVPTILRKIDCDQPSNTMGWTVIKRTWSSVASLRRHVRNTGPRVISKPVAELGGIAVRSLKAEMASTLASSWVPP